MRPTVRRMMAGAAKQGRNQGKKALALGNEMDDSFLDPSAPLLTRERAAEHVLHAIANGRCDLLTPGVLNLLGPAKVEESAEAVASWEFAGHCFLQCCQYDVIAI